MGAQRAPSRQDQAPSRQDQVPSRVEPIRVPSRQEVPRAADIVAEIKDMGERVPSRLRVVSRPASRTKSAAAEEEKGWEWDNGDGDWEGYDGEWEYYYEEDYKEEDKDKEKTKEAPVTTTLKPPTIIVNKDSRPNSRQSSRPNSRSSSRPTSRASTRAASRILRNPSALGSVYEEDWDEDDDELGRLSPTLTTAPTTRATSPFPNEKEEIPHNTGSGFSGRRCSVIQES